MALENIFNHTVSASRGSQLVKKTRELGLLFGLVLCDPASNHCKLPDDSIIRRLTLVCLAHVSKGRVRITALEVQERSLVERLDVIWVDLEGLVAACDCRLCCTKFLQHGPGCHKWSASVPMRFARGLFQLHGLGIQLLGW
jgi:hypothetical protein